MPSNYIGRNRSNGLYRIILGFIIVSTAGVYPLALIAIGVIAAVIYHVVDVVLQVLFNSNGLSDSGPWGFLRDLYKWPLAQLSWFFFGGREFPWLPRSL